MAEFTKQFFIDKFTKIPDEEIGGGSLENHCALWHCGVEKFYQNPSLEALALIRLFGGETIQTETYEHIQYNYVYEVNDGHRGYDKFGKTPKERILTRLKLLPD